MPSPSQISAEDIDNVLAFLPVLEAIEREGVEHYYQQASQLLRAFWVNGFVLKGFVAVDWQPARYFGDRNLVAAADFITCLKLTTFNQRAAHFDEDHLDEVLKSGHLLALLRRIAVLRNEVTSLSHYPTSGHPRGRHQRRTVPLPTLLPNLYHPQTLWLDEESLPPVPASIAL